MMTRFYLSASSSKLCELLEHLRLNGYRITWEESNVFIADDEDVIYIETILTDRNITWRKEKKNHKNNEMKTAYEKAGYRERFAMDNGNRAVVNIHNHKCYKFTYSKGKEYQDANGATYDTVTKEWIY